MTTLGLIGTRFEAPDPDPIPAKKDEPTGSQPNAGKGKDEGDERYTALQNELAELRSSNRQLMDLFGRNVPQNRQDAPAAEPVSIDWGKDEDVEDDTDEPEDPAALVEDLSKLGPQALAKRGFVRKADVLKLVREESRKAAATAATQVVAKARTEVTRESQVIREFPELGDPDSELYKATAEHVRAAVKIDPAAAKNPVTLYLAAQAAKAQLGAKKGNREQPDDDRETRRRSAFNDDFDMDDEDDDREPVMREKKQPTERQRRIDAQAGDRGRSGRSKVESDDDDFVMNAEARELAAQMGLSADEYKTEASRIRKAAAARGAGRRR